MIDVLENFKEVQDEIKQTLTYINHPERKINLVAVSKTFAVERITPLLEAGHRVFGENRVQEAQGKWTLLKQQYPDIELHLIGPLQRNKVRDAVKIFDVIESVASISIAEAIKEECIRQEKELTFFAQVNTGIEPQKSGLHPHELENFLNTSPLTISGLMCIPPINDEPSVHFHLLSNLAKKFNIKHLSMGMSADFKTGVMLGADYVRVGSKIFGERK